MTVYTTFDMQNDTSRRKIKNMSLLVNYVVDDAYSMKKCRKIKNEYVSNRNVDTIGYQNLVKLI